MITQHYHEMEAETWLNTRGLAKIFNHLNFFSISFHVLIEFYHDKWTCGAIYGTPKF